MVPQFINRKIEIKFLEDIYNERSFNAVIIYGRRRVGKTELIKQFLKNKKAIYFLATDESMNENLKELKRLFAEITGKDYLLRLDAGFSDLFRYLQDEIKDEKIVIAIDEFPYLLNLNKGILSTFQKIIDEELKDTQVTLLITGSSMGIMETDVLGYKSPLYGRDLNVWKVAQFQFKDIHAWFKILDKALEAYFIFGNIPYYLKFFDPEKPIDENIRQNMLTKGRNLYDEPLILLRQEFRESRVYTSILKYISLGYTSMGKLCSATGLDKSNISKYLSSLEETHIIKHIVPIGMKRNGIYDITDPFIRFWFRFVYPRRNDLELGNIDAVMNDINKDLTMYIGHIFENLCEELLRTKLFEEFENYNQIGRWWHKDKEIDIVALNEQTKEIMFVECKWQNSVNAERILVELKEKSKYVQWSDENRKEQFCIIAKSFKRKLDKKDCLCFDLKDIEKMMR